MEQFCWAVGCINMGLSLGFQAYAHHSKQLKEINFSESFLRATSVHQIASLGFMLLSFKGAPLPAFLMLSAATLLFPYVIYYQGMFYKGQRLMLSPLVPKAGMLHMLFWVTMGLFYFSNESTQNKQE